MFDFSDNHLNFILDITEENIAILENFSYNREKGNRKKKGKWCNVVETHVCGENPDDHHFAKHTDGWLCSAYRLKDCVRMAVWRMNTEKESVDVPLEKTGGSKILYPKNSDAVLAETKQGLRITLRKPFSAIVLEIGVRND